MDEQSGSINFRDARRPTRVYSGSRDAERCVVHVRDSARGPATESPTMLSPDASRMVHDYCDCFDWGSTSPPCRQLAVALLLDVTGDPEKARMWSELFTEKYVNNLSANWTVPEIDIELWLYCFENARQDN